jgi:hypothetical protein
MTYLSLFVNKYHHFQKLIPTRLLLLEAIAWSTKHHTLAALAEQQVNEWTNKWGCPDDHQPEYGTSHRMVILKDHHGFNDVTDDRDEDDYQEKQ